MANKANFNWCAVDGSHRALLMVPCHNTSATSTFGAISGATFSAFTYEMSDCRQ